MYEEDPNLEKPTNEHSVIWRYTDFTKLLSLIDRESLFFTRVDKFEDPFEGSLSKANVKLRPSNFTGNLPHEEIATLSEFYKAFVKLTYVNCWHQGSYQSAALWQAYLQSCNGVAIRSTFARLRDSFRLTDYKVRIGKVIYINYKKDLMPEGALYPYFHKRKNFKDENELRAVIQEFSYKDNGEIDWDKSPFNDGLYVEVDLEKLIDKIYLGPKCPKWQVEVIHEVASKYGLSKRILKSIAKSSIYDRAKIVY